MECSLYKKHMIKNLMSLDVSCLGQWPRWSFSKQCCNPHSWEVGRGLCSELRQNCQYGGEDDAGPILDRIRFSDIPVTAYRNRFKGNQGISERVLDPSYLASSCRLATSLLCLTPDRTSIDGGIRHRKSKRKRMIFLYMQSEKCRYV